MHPAKPFRRREILKSAHRMRALFTTSMVLLQVVVQIAVGLMAYGFPQLGFDRAGIGIMPVGRYALRNTAGDYTGGPKERFRRGSVPLLA
jgi:hypothetical protein